MDNVMNRLHNTLIDLQLLLPLDVLFVGSTGSGKSSTINALAKKMLAAVGNGVEPQTQKINDYQLESFFRVHDSAGLGDSYEADLSHKKMITQHLKATCTQIGDPSREYAFIDLVVVIIEGGIRDMGTSFNLLESVILPAIDQKRVVVIINQADMLMKGRHWDASRSEPDKILLEMLELKASSVQQRIMESTGILIRKPTFYSAEFGYNIDKVLTQIIEQLPSTQRRLKI